MNFRSIWLSEFGQWPLRKREAVYFSWRGDCRDDDPKQSSRLNFAKGTLGVFKSEDTLIDKDDGLLLADTATNDIVAVGNWSVYSNILSLQQIAVAPDIYNRGIKGVGTEYMRRLGKFVLENDGLNSIELQAFEDNYLFYEKLGFVISHKSHGLLFMKWDIDAIRKIIYVHSIQ